MNQTAYTNSAFVSRAFWWLWPIVRWYIVYLCTYLALMALVAVLAPHNVTLSALSYVGSFFGSFVVYIYLVRLHNKAVWRERNPLLASQGFTQKDIAALAAMLGPNFDGTGREEAADYHALLRDRNVSAFKKRTQGTPYQNANASNQSVHVSNPSVNVATPNHAQNPHRNFQDPSSPHDLESELHNGRQSAEWDTRNGRHFEAEETAGRMAAAELRARQDAQDAANREAERRERDRRDAEDRARREADDRARREADDRARRESEERAREEQRRRDEDNRRY